MQTIKAYFIQRLLRLFEALALGAFAIWAVLSIAMIERGIDYVNHRHPLESHDLSTWSYLVFSLIALPIYIS